MYFLLQDGLLSQILSGGACSGLPESAKQHCEINHGYTAAIQISVAKQEVRGRTDG